MCQDETMFDQIGEKLSHSIFKTDELGKYGKTGVDEERFKHELLFPNTPDEAACTIKAEDYGVVANTQEDMREKLKNVIEVVKALGDDVQKTLILPEGSLYIYDEPDQKNAYAIDLQGIKNLRVEGGETAFIMDMTSRGIRVENCENVVLRGMSFDRFDLPYFMGTVEKMHVENQYAILNINDGYDPETPYPVREYLEYNVEDKTPRYHGNFLYNNLEVTTLVESIQGVEVTGDHQAKIRFSWELTEAPKGCGYVITKTMYGIDTIAIIESRKIYFEDVSVYCTPGMGIRGYSSEDVYLNRTNVMLKPGSDRFMTVTADAMHFMDCKGDLQLTNCLMENSHDDAINIHGMFQMVVEVDESQNRYRLLSGRTAKFDPPSEEDEEPAKDELTIPFEAGDEIEVSEDDTMNLLATVHVERVEKDAKYGFWVTFQEDVKFDKGVLMCNVTRSPKVLVENCVFRNKRNRGILLQSRNSAIRNCTFYNVLMPAICLIADCKDWHEGINGNHIRIENNRFINTNLIKNNLMKLSNGDIDIGVYGKTGSLQAGLISDVQIVNNAFLASGGNCISVKSAGDVAIKENLFWKCGSEIGKDKRAPVVQENAVDIEISENDVVER